MTKQTQVAKPATTDDAAMFARIANAKGVTLSGGTVAATGKKLTKAERKAAKAAKPVVEQAAPEAPAPVTKSTPVTDAPALNADGTPIEKVRRSIVPMKFKERYSKHGGTCGDDMAMELKAATTTRNADKREVLDVEALWAIAKSNKIDVAKYLDLNNGQKRMNVGNKLRGRLAAGADVVIGARTFKAEDFVPKH